MSTNNLHKHDPLLQCLVAFSNLYHTPISIETLIAGLPTEPGKISPTLFSVNSSHSLFSRVAERAGYKARLIEMPLNEFSPLLLPAILTLKNNGACVLEEIDLENSKAKIILPELQNSEEWIDFEKLEEEYLGYAFLLKREYKYQKRKADLIHKADEHWFWGTLKKSKGIYATVITASIMVNLFVLATPLFTMNVYDRVVPNSAIETLWVLVIGLLIVYMFDSVLKLFRNYLLEIAGKKSDIIMSSMIYEHVMNMRYENWPARIGSFANNLREFESIRNFLTSSTLLALVDLPFAFIFIVVIFYISGSLVLVPITFSLLILLYGIIIKKPLVKSIESTFEASSNKNSHLIESLNMIQTIKVMGASHAMQWVWEESTGEIANKSMKSRLISSSMSVVTNLLIQLNTVAIIIFGVYLISELKMSMGALIATTMLSSRIIAPMGQVAGLIANYQQTKTAYQSLDAIMQAEVERPLGKDFIVREAFDGAIRFKNVGFHYPNSSKESLMNININIQPGEKVAIIGKVGSGKTTLSKLIVGLYKTTEGTLSFDGIDCNQIDPVNIREFVSYLSQDVELITGTIRDNITIKDPSVNHEEIIRASKIGGVDSFINDLELGFDTPVGEKGMQLSGGQRQAIAIARACLLHEKIIVMDEPTNSFDNTTESLIRRRLHDYTRDKTFILITHKAQMLNLVDRLIVIDDGRIIMDGPKEKVLKSLSGDNSE